MAGFRFTELSVELAFEVIHHAARPDWHDTQTLRYETAVAMCSVSHAVRRAAMPHLLHTVSLTSSSQVLAFIDAVLLQHSHHINLSPLAIDYAIYLKRLWCRECWEPLVDQSPNLPILNYKALYEVMRNVDSLGLDFNSLHLLYNGLASAGINPALDWRCRKVTFTGDFWRWRPLTMTPEGSAFLAQITHLVLWIPSKPFPQSTGGRGLGGDARIPDWIQHVPFSSFLSLQRIAFPLSSRSSFHACPGFTFSEPMRMLVYTAPQSSKFDTGILKELALSNDPATFGAVVSIMVTQTITAEGHRKAIWEDAYLQGNADGLWTTADYQRNKAMYPDT